MSIVINLRRWGDDRAGQDFGAVLCRSATAHGRRGANSRAGRPADRLRGWRRLGEFYASTARGQGPRFLATRRCRRGGVCDTTYLYRTLDSERW